MPSFLRYAVSAAVLLFVSACGQQQQVYVADIDEVSSVISSGNTNPVLPAADLEPGEQVVPDRVLFAYDSHELSPGARDILQKQAIWLKLSPMTRIVVEGHCDERGTREYNIALGVLRAVAVRNFLVSYGAAPGQIETVSYGKEKPVALCSDESCWSQNRRAVSVIQDLEEKLKVGS